MRCGIDTNEYEKGIKVSDEALNIRGHEFHREWNYWVSPSETFTQVIYSQFLSNQWNSIHELKKSSARSFFLVQRTHNSFPNIESPWGMVIVVFRYLL